MKLILAILFLIPSMLFALEPVEKHPEWDQDYSKKIREYTTDPQFLTDLVDHLPASDKVPTPQKFLGYISGTPDRLTYSEDVHRYMRELEAASPRVKVFTIGQSEEGREMILVAIADEETIANLDRYKEITRKLSDPRKITDEEAVQLAQQGKPFYFVTGAMHSPETGSPEMLMELAYRLVVDESAMMRKIRSSIITMITPVLEVDGRNRMVDIVRWHQAHPDAGVPPLAYWGHYVAHDNNRDTMGLALNLTRNILKTYFEWHPQVIHDLHESIPFLYISTGTGPYNAWLDPLTINEWQRMAYNEVQTLTAKGLPGVWTHGFFDGWAPNYMFWVALGHNSIGRFYETFGNLVPSTQDRTVRERSQRAWFRPNPPLPKVKWSLRNNVNYQQSGVLLALEYMADNREHFLKTFWLLGKRSIAKATMEGPAAYVFDGNQKRKGQLRDLLHLLQTQGVEIHQTDQEFSVKLNWPPKKKDDETEKPADSKDQKKEAKEEKKEEDTAKFPAGSFVIRMDQPYSRMADALLDTQYVRGEEDVYDDTGWTLGYTKNLEFKRIVNQDVLKAPMHPWDGAMPQNLGGKSGAAIAIRNTADTDLVRLRFALADVPFSVLDEKWKLKTASWPAGTIIIVLDGTNSNKVEEALRNVNVDSEMLPQAPAAKMHSMAAPRIAILHTWIDTQDEGWFRLAFENLKVPYDYISTQDVSRETDLRAKYDVVLFPPCDCDPQDIVNGLPAGPPLPWKKSDLTPNLAVDETEDMRPGLGLNGVANLKKFVEDGGLLITVRETAQWAAEYGLARWVTVEQPEQLKANGSILQTSLTDKISPIGWGYDENIPVHFAGSPVFSVGTPFDPGKNKRPDQRPSGRGSQADPDVPQGRPFMETPEKPKPGPGEQGFQLPEDLPFFYQPYLPRVEERPRVILSFPKEPDKILLSGMLEGADQIAGKPVVIDSPLGKGHILLFANNPMWRMNTQGDFALVFNAILNYQNLNLGWPPPPDRASSWNRVGNFEHFRSPAACR